MSFTFKIVLLGDSASKTVLVNRYLTKMFDDSIKMTIGADFYVKDLEIDGKKVTLRIWDLGGEQRFKVLLPIFTKGANGALVIYDVTNYYSIAHIDDWLDIIRKENRAEVPILLLGIILDEKKKRSVSAEEGKKIAKSRNLNGHIECNLKTGKNVDEAFDVLTRLILTSPQFCHKCQKEFTFEEFLIHPCFTSGDVLSTGVVNVIGIVMRKLKQRRFWPLKNSKVIAAAIVQGNDTILYSTDKWDFSDDFIKFLSTWNSIKAKSIKISGVKYEILQSTSRRFVATANKGKTHIVGAKERDKTLLLYLKPNGKVAYDPVKDKFYIIQSLKDEESKKKSDKGFDDEREEKKGRNKRYLTKKERRKKEEAKDEEYLITYTRHLEKRLRNLETENQLLDAERLRLESMEVTDPLPDMRYPRNFERDKGDFKFLEERINVFGDLVEKMMSVILKIPDLVDQSLATVNQKIATLESRINGTSNQKPTTTTKDGDQPTSPLSGESRGAILGELGQLFSEGNKVFKKKPQIFEIVEDGTTRELTTYDAIKNLLKTDKCYVIVSDEYRKVYLWKGVNSNVRSKFIGAKRSQDIRGQVGMHYGVVPLDEGEEDPDFIKLIGGRTEGNDEDNLPYPYVFKPPEPPDDFALAPQVQLRAPFKEKNPEEEIHCQYCGIKLTKEEEISHSCKEKPEKNSS